MPTYEDVDETFEYLDLSRKNLGVLGIQDILNDIEYDTLLKHLDISYNMTSDEAEQPSKMKILFNTISKAFKRNKTLTALDLAGNHMFQNSIHPLNEHLTNYFIDFTDSLCLTNIKRINISDNNIVGTGRKNKGLAYFIKKYVSNKAIGFTCRSNNMYSPSFVIISTLFKPKSTLTYLDLSDNKGGLNPNLRGDSEGISALCRQIIQSEVLSHLILANNCLRDEDIVLISDACALMPSIRVLNIAGNECHGIGADSIKRMVSSHCTLENNYGIRELDLSSNPIGNIGIEEINHCLSRSLTLTSLNISHCQINTEGMESFLLAIKENPYIVKLEIHSNYISKILELKVLAEAAVNRHLVTITMNPKTINADDLSYAEYHALAYKLKFLSTNSLIGLHLNESFNRPLSLMKESLHLLQAPGRKYQFKEVYSKDPGLIDRLAEVRNHNRRMFYARKVYAGVMRWFKIVHERNVIKKAMLEAKRKRDEENKKNLDDEIWPR